MIAPDTELFVLYAPLRGYVTALDPFEYSTDPSYAYTFRTGQDAKDAADRFQTTPEVVRLSTSGLDRVSAIGDLLGSVGINCLRLPDDYDQAMGIARRLLEKRLDDRTRGGRNALLGRLRDLVAEEEL